VCSSDLHAFRGPCVLGPHRRLRRGVRPGSPLSKAGRGDPAVVVNGREASEAHVAPAGELRAVTKVYGAGSPGEVRALDGVDLTIERGEMVALVGPSGCGKSTLLHILGLLERPTSGQVTVAGIDPLRVPRRALPSLRNRCVGFVFQRHHLVPALTALENVAVPLRYRGLSRSEALRSEEHTSELQSRENLV